MQEMKNNDRNSTTFFVFIVHFFMPAFSPIIILCIIILAFLFIPKNLL